MGVGMERSRLAPAVAALLVSLAVALLVVDPGSAAYPKAKPGEVLYAAGNAGPGGDIVIAAADGSSTTNLTSTQAGFADHPDISPNGKLVVYDTNPGGGAHDIWMMNRNGSGKRNLTPGTSTDERNPVFAPNGRKIFFDRDGPNPSEIWSMNLKGGDQVNLTRHPADDRQPAVFPDGRRLVFASERQSPDLDLFLMNVNGSNVTPLTVAAGPDDRNPGVSPSGKLIAFSRENGFGYEVAVMTLGGSPDLITDTIPGTGFNPVFSADGRKIFFGTNAPGGGGAEDVWSMNADGTSPVPISKTNALVDAAVAAEAVFRCAGRRATIVGSDGKDKLNGTRRADVIVGNGGRDVLRGRGGRDRLCGGKGRDRLIGGGALDRLLGGPGRDLLAQ